MKGRELRGVVVALLVYAGCNGPPLTETRPTSGQSDAGCCANKYDLLFVIDDSPSMAPLQQKLFAQLPTFMAVLQNLPNPPSLHVAVISSDLGAPSDQPGAIGCSANGDGGAFQSRPRGTCTDSTLDQGATFIVDDPTTGIRNFGLPESTGLPAVFQCIGMLGASGCEFGHPLAAIDRALGADGLGPPPPGNEGFLRPDAYLAIILIGNEDDCSAPANTTIFSLNGHPNDISNPDGPLTHYRCNGGPRGAHYCQDPANGNAWMIPPLNPPTDAQGTAAAPTLDLVNCQDNEQPPHDTGTSALTPVGKFVADIRALKPEPDAQILVSGVIGPAWPYAVSWAPPSGGQNTTPGELWPEVMHSCGASGGDGVNPAASQFTADGSFGDPGVREMQFLDSFTNSVVASICDPRYSPALEVIATALGSLVRD